MTSASASDVAAARWSTTLAHINRQCDSQPSACVAEVPALLERARAEGLVAVEVELEYMGGFASHLLSDDAFALSAMERALVLCRRHGLRRWEGRVLQGMAAVHNGFGDNISALDFLEQSLAIRRELDDTEGLAVTLNNLADTYLSMGRFLDKARELLVEAAELWPGLDRPDGTCATLANLAKLDTDEADALAFVDPERSRLLADRAIESAARGVVAAQGEEGNPRMAVEGQIRLARAFMARGDLEQAQLALEGVRDVIPQIAVTYLTIRFHAATGRLSRLRGDHAAAAATLTEGLHLSGRKLRPLERADLLDELVRVHEDAGDHAAALAAHREYHAAVLAQRDDAAERRGVVLNAQLELERARRATDTERSRAERLAELNETLRHQAVHDPLTGVLNRRGLDAFLDARLDDDAPLAYVQADLDLFKSVNDDHSHPVGDEVLRRVAEIMASTVRTGDAVARIGGEEFALVLVDTPEPQAVAICERIRAEVAGYPWGVLSPALAVTMSLGGAMVLPDDDPGTVAVRADAALYEAKRLGRNRVAFGDEFAAASAEPEIA